MLEHYQWKTFLVCWKFFPIGDTGPCSHYPHHNLPLLKRWNAYEETGEVQNQIDKITYIQKSKIYLHY